MNVITKRKSKKIISQSDINIISPLDSLESHKVLYFHKIDSVNHINTLGSQPIIVYKKSSKNKSQIQKNSTPSSKNSKKNSRYEKNQKKEVNNKLGNIENKLQKFKSFSNTQKNFNKNIKLAKTKSFNRNIILIEKDKKLKEEQDKMKNINEQKLFSKTVRDSNMRPIFPKNKSKQLTSTKIGFNNNIINNKKINEENKEDNEDNNEDIIAKKNLMMNQLVQNAIVIEMKKYQDYPNNNKNNLEFIKNNKKREFLEENGITTSTEELTINEDNEKINNNNKNKKRTSDTLSHPKINNYLQQDNTMKNIYPISPKTKNKPEIEQFEYLIRINEEKKKLISEMRSIYRQNKNQININKDNMVKKNNYISPKVYPSFRTNNKQYFEEEKKVSNDTLENSNSYSYNLKDRRNHRSTNEINQYLREKKLKNKQIEENKQLEKNKKLFLRFKNLYNLNMKDNNNTNHLNKEINSDNDYNKFNTKYQQNKKIIKEERKDEYIESEENTNEEIFDVNSQLYKNLNNNQHNKIRKRKELNEYYIGNDSTIRNNNSTLVDANEYYLNILESQQLLVNSKLKKIEDGNDNNNNENQIDINQNIII